jgi:hypothetical protein
LAPRFTALVSDYSLIFRQTKKIGRELKVMLMIFHQLPPALAEFPPALAGGQG